MLFTGEFKCKFDDKGRLRMPGELKRQLSPKAAGKFVVNRGLDGCLELYPKDLWDVTIRAIMQSLNKYDPNDREFLRRFQSGSAEMELDSADRLNFPNYLLKEMDIKGEVYLTPGQGTIEIWSEERYQQRMKAFDQTAYEKIAQSVMSKVKVDYFREGENN